MTSRRSFLAGLTGVVATAAFSGEARAGSFFEYLKARQKLNAEKNAKIRAAGKEPTISYKGAAEVAYTSMEKPGTLIIKTSERALYQILGDGKAMKFSVAVGKEGFSWAGVARVGAKRENPTWTPPPEMIKRTPKYAKWANGMPGGLPYNPLGPRAMYLFNKGGDTGFRIHGTIHPESIGHAASSGCIRMLNAEVIRLYDQTKVGTKVIVL